MLHSSSLPKQCNFFRRCAEASSKLARDQAALDDIQQKNATVEKASKDLNAWLDNAKANLLGVSNARLTDEDTDRRLKDLEVCALKRLTCFATSVLDLYFSS